MKPGIVLTLLIAISFISLVQGSTTYLDSGQCYNLTYQEAFHNETSNETLFLNQTRVFCAKDTNETLYDYEVPIFIEGDGVCQLSENFDTCPSDCNLNKVSCEEQGGTLIVKTTTHGKGPLGIGKLFGWTYDEVTEVCRIPHVSVIAIVLIVLGIGILIFSIFKSVPIGMMSGVILSLLGAVWSILAGVGYV